MHRVPITRRTGVVGLLIAGALVPVAVAVAAFAYGGDGKAPTAALPLHPVAGSFKPDDTRFENCAEQRCYEQALGNVAYYEGPKAAMAVVDKTIAPEGDAQSCHRIVHAIGAASLARYKGNVARTFAEGSASCFSGYYHGVLERSLVGVRGYEPEALGRVAQGLCADAQLRRVRWLGYQCLHGLGHGLMITSGYSLPLSLDVCNRLSAEWDRTSCKGGAFMENISTSYGVASRWVREDDPVYPCNWVDERDKVKCYEIVTSRILRVVGWDWDETAGICAGVETNWVSACFRSFGRDAAGTTGLKPDEILELCAVARVHGGEASCVTGAAVAMTGNFSSGEQASVLCDRAAPEFRDRCYFAVGSIMGGFKATLAERVADCRSLSAVERYVGQCIRGVSRNLPAFVDQ